MGTFKEEFSKTPGYPGARLLSTDTETRPLPVPVGGYCSKWDQFRNIKRRNSGVAYY